MGRQTSPQEWAEAGGRNEGMAKRAGAAVYTVRPPFGVYSLLSSRGSLGLKVGLRRTLLRKWVVS